MTHTAQETTHLLGSDQSDDEANPFKSNQQSTSTLYGEENDSDDEVLRGGDDYPRASGFRVTMRRLTQSVQDWWGSKETLVPQRTARAHSFWEAPVAYAAAAVTYLTWYMLFAIIAAQPIIAGEIITVLQALAIAVTAYWFAVANKSGLLGVIYAACLEPMFWKAAHVKEPTGDTLFDVALAQAHPQGLLKSLVVAPALTYARADEDDEAPNDRRLLTLPNISVNSDEQPLIEQLPPLDSTPRPLTALAGLLGGLPRFISYAILSPLAACIGVPSTFILELLSAISLGMLADMRIGAYAGILLAIGVQWGHYWLTPANNNSLSGTPFEVLARGVAHQFPVIKALLYKYWPDVFDTAPIEASDTPLSATTILACLAAIPAGVAYRAMLFVAAIFGLIPGVAAGYAYFEDITFSPESLHTIRMAALPAFIPTFNVEFSHLITAEIPSDAIPGQATPGLVTEEAGITNAIAQSLAHPYPTAKLIVREIYSRLPTCRMPNWTFFSSDTDEAQMDETRLIPANTPVAGLGAV